MGVIGVIQIACREGGHDYAQITALLRECLDETLRSKGSNDLVCAILGCLVVVAEARKALYFEPSTDKPVEEIDPKKAKGAPVGGPGQGAPIDATLLPKKIALDIEGHLRRQGPKEGALSFSAAALQDAQKTVPFRTVVRHSLALRRECDMFASFFHTDRLLCDQLHIALSQSSDAYSSARILDDAQLKAIEAPPETPTAGDCII